MSAGSTDNLHRAKSAAASGAKTRQVVIAMLYHSFTFGRAYRESRL